MNLGFKARIYLNVTILVTLALAILGTVNTYHLQQKMTAALVKQTELQLQSLVSNTEIWFASKENAINSGADYFSKDLSAADNIQLLTLIKNSGKFASASVTYNNGVSYQTHGGQHQRDDNATHTAWYRHAINQHAVVVTDIYDDPQTKKKMVSITKSVTQNGKNIGVLKGTIDIDDVAEKINAIRFAGGAATLVDRNAVFFASDDPTDIGKTPSEVNPVFSDMERGFQSNEQGHLSFPYLGIDFTGYYQRIHLTPDNHWTLMIFIDKATALAAVKGATWDAIWFGIVLVIISALGVILTIKMAYKPLLNLKAAVSDLGNGNGDLTVRLDENGTDDLAQISQSFNLFIGQLQHMMLNVAKSTESISSGITQLGQGAQENEAQLLSHSAETDQVVTAITELSESSRSVAINVSDSNTLTTSAAQEAQASLNIVDNAVQNVKALVDQVDEMSVSIHSMNADAGKINDVVNVIEDISGQINLLALNAAIEAARAGDAGRGFAVVADEVRALAVRTQNSTTEISTILQLLLDGSSVIATAMERIQTQCQSSADSTAQVSVSLSSVSDSVAEIDNVSTQIATATEEQNRVTDELSNNMLAIREIAESLVVSGRQTVSATQLLGTANKELEALVSQFKLY